jgi:transcriptional regulator with XRE-family HTH domain
MSERSRLDFGLIAHNIRCIRMAQSLTQADLAERAGLDKATVHRLESGKRIHLRSLEKISEVFRETVEFFNSVLPYGLPDQTQQIFVHRRADLNWFAGADKRKKVPADSQKRIQDQSERLRLGRAGLVAWFQAYTFAMPNSPGMSLSEIYGEVQWGPNATYRDSVTYCLRGEVIVTVADQTFCLGEGDGIGHSTSLTISIRPARSIGPNELPPLVAYITANRTGHVPIEFHDRKRMRTRHSSKRSS